MSIGGFAQLPQTTQIVFIFAAVILIMAGYYLIFRRGIKIGKRGITIAGNGFVPESSPHANCKHRHDAIDTIRGIYKNSDERGRVRDIDGMKQQMDLAELFAKRMTSELTHVYLKALQEKGIEDPVSTSSFASYENVLIILESRLIAEVRHYIKENHFVEKSGKEFDSYVSTRIRQLIDLSSKTLNDVYLFKKDITRAELYEKNKERRKDFEAMGESWFFCFF